MTPRAKLLASFALVVVALGGCTNTTDAALFARNPLTGEVRRFPASSDVPEGWDRCAAEGDCPPITACPDLDEAACLARIDCGAIYASTGAFPRECDSATPPEICTDGSFAGCEPAGPTCDDVRCGPAPAAPTYACRDGSLGGNTGRCMASADGTCGWEIRPCPVACTPEACGPPPGAPAFLCADGTVAGPECVHLDDDSCGWRLSTCPTPMPTDCDATECGSAPSDPTIACRDGSIGGPVCRRDADGTCSWDVTPCTDICADVPVCRLACPAGTHNPVDEYGCIHYCECVPSGECAPSDCGPEPGILPRPCPDGSGAGAACVRTDTGRCGWVIRECPVPCELRPMCDLFCPPGTHNPIAPDGCLDSCQCVPDDRCGPEACGPAPLSPTFMCPDGSTGGNTGLCLPRTDGTCGWEFRECPIACSDRPLCGLYCPPGTHNPIGPDGCTDSCTCVPDGLCGPDACGPGLDSPTLLCSDGSVGGNTGRCLPNSSGGCGWEMRPCPPDPTLCAVTECGPALRSPILMCADGTIGGNTGRCLRDAAGVCAWELRPCPDPCSSLPVCDLVCPAGTHNPVDSNGCTRYCECVADSSAGGTPGSPP